MADELVIDFDFDANNPEPQKKLTKINKKVYLVTEADTAAVTAYRNACMRATKLSDGKVSGMEGMANADPLLVSLCTFETDSKGNPSIDAIGRPLRVPLMVVDTWPGRVTKTLYNWIKEVSEIEDLDDEEALDKEIERLNKKKTELKERKKSKAKNGQSG